MTRTRQTITARFLKEYASVFRQVEGMVAGLAGGEEERRLFTQGLFARLLFIHFLSKTGWLCFQGSADYLAALWRGRQRDGCFYHSHILPLFAALNNPHVSDVKVEAPGACARVGRVPFINCGFFCEAGRQCSGENVPDEAFDLVLNGLLARFEFTLIESVSPAAPSAVDPEILGTVFEELSMGRQESGSYYTPRPVVAFMCREALKGFLGDGEAVAAFVDGRDTTLLPDPEGTLARLKELRVCDPACGSGAYLVGMLHELADLRLALFRNCGVDPSSEYQRKREIIQENLYGVDVDPFAAEMARLRLWLSLAADYEGDQSFPWPDFNIRVGDSLLSPLASGVGQARSSRKGTESEPGSLNDGTGEPACAMDGRSAGVEGSVLTLPAATARPLDWHAEFSAVFARNRGFHIILMNPPYVSANRLPGHGQQDARDYRKELRAHYGFSGDLYVHFVYRALDLLGEAGELYALTPGTYLSGCGAEPLRRRLLQHHLRLLSPLSREVFPAAVYSCILGVRKGPRPADGSLVRFLNGRNVRRDETSFWQAPTDRALSIPVEEYDRSFQAIFFEPTPANRVLFGHLLSGRDRMEFGGREFVPLGKAAPVLDTGIDSGNVRRKLFHREDQKRGLPRLLQGVQVVRYGTWWDNPVARYYYADIDYQPDGNVKGVGRGGRPSGHGEYWKFRGPVQNHHAPERLLMRQTEDEPFVGYLRQGDERVYTDNTVHTLLLSEEGRSLGLTYSYLLGILNSASMRSIYRALAQEEGRTLAQVKTLLANRLPIPLPSTGERPGIEELVEAIQRIYGDEGFPLAADALASIERIQAALDGKVAAMYGLILPMA